MRVRRIALLVLAATAHAGTILMPQPQSGLPAVLRANARRSPNLLQAPARLSVREAGEKLPTPVFAPDGGVEYGATLGEQKLHLTLAYPSGDARCLELTVSDLGDKPRSLLLTLTLSLRPTASRAFFPAGSSPQVTLVRGAPAVGYGYAAGGIPLGLPLGQVFDPQDDWGVAWFGWLGRLVEPLGCRVSRSTAAITVELTLPVTCPAGRSVARRIGFAVTPGDWRPALAELLAAFPRSFAPSLAVAPLQGPFVCSGGTPTDAQIQDWHDQGCRVVEIHGTAPWYGEYVPQASKWTAFVDDQWHFLRPRFEPPQRPADDAPWEVIRDWVEQQTPPTHSRAAVNDYIQRLHAHGMKGLIYFNPTEAWKPWALARFPDDRSLDPNGEPYPTWYESAQMIPDKDRPWGRYMLEQLRGELDIYPEVDGVFFDQSAGGGHDLAELCEAGTRIVRAQGKLCWWNGPFNLELAQLADGMMTEGGGTDTYRHLTEMMQYYGMAGKPIVSLGPADTAGYAECLVHGVIPTPVSKASAEMGERWFPLFRWLGNRKWVLEPRALDVPDGVSANLYRVPDGNLVVPFCREPLPDDKTARQFELAFTIRTTDAGSLRAAYLLEPDLRGCHKLPFARSGKALTVAVPRMGPAGLLVLAKSGVFAAAEGGLAVVAGRPARLRWTVDNWTAKPVRVAFAGGAAQSVAAGRSVAREATGTPAGERWAVPLSAKVDGRELAGPAEVWVDPPLLLFADAPAEIRDDQRLALTARLLSHLPAGTRLKLTAGAEGIAFDPAEAAVAAAPERAVSVRLAGRPTAAGEQTVRLGAVASDGTTATAEVTVAVVASALAPGGFDKIRAASLQLDVFGVDRAQRGAHRQPGGRHVQGPQPAARAAHARRGDGGLAGGHGRLHRRRGLGARGGHRLRQRPADDRDGAHGAGGPGADGALRGVLRHTAERAAGARRVRLRRRGVRAQAGDDQRRAAGQPAGAGRHLGGEEPGLGARSPRRADDAQRGGDRELEPHRRVQGPPGVDRDDQHKREDLRQRGR
ncbi:MAG: hypothetical protein HYU66_00400 [Armatimonadetes bacterium]|nr:hypothetical protein [Armatimonadota bacterium]